MLDISKIYNSNNFGQFKILNYFNCESISIEFIDTGYKTTARADNIVKGRVKDKLSPYIYSIGFIGDGDYKAKVNGKETKAYKTWQGMLTRCYDDKSLIKHPTYIGCSVDPIWHNFQNFAQWFDEHYVTGYHLDKDIKFDGNRIYAPDKCKFVSHKENNIKARAKHYVFTSPKGETVYIYNLNAFCRENGLCHPRMSKVANGTTSHHKQWTKNILNEGLNNND